MLNLLRMMLRVGRVAEPAPAVLPPSDTTDASAATDTTDASAATDTTDASAATDTTDASAATDTTDTTDTTAATDAVTPLPWTGSIQVRHVDAGSCNGCEIEIGACFGPVYDAERYGARLVASPRHADVLLVTGPVTRNMAEPLRITHAAMPAPKRVVAIGDCARSCGVFAGAYGVEGPVGDIVPVDVEVPGCPPSPEDIIAALRGLTGR